MFDLITVLTRSRALRIAAEARSADPDNGEAEHSARVALLALAAGMDMHVDPVRPARWSDLAPMALKLEAAAYALADLREGSFDQAGAIAALALHFGAVASRMGCDVEPLAETNHDDAAMAAVDGGRIAAE
jgi:hypothetical protein